MSARPARDEHRGSLYGRVMAQRSLILVTCVGVLAGGTFSLSRLPSGIYPELDFPRIVVVARSGDEPPPLVQATIARPLEASLATVLGVRRIRTKIIRGTCEIALQLTDGTDTWRALQMTEAALANARGSLPPDVDIDVQRITPADFPVLSFNVVGSDATTRREAADMLIRPALSRVPGVGSVEVIGGDPREIEVELDPARLAAIHLRPSEAAARVRDGIVRQAVGRFEEMRQAVVATASTRVADAASLARLPIASAPLGPVPLSQVATIREGAPDRVLAVHAPEGDAVQVAISRMVGASAPELVQRVRETVATLRLPSGVRMVLVYDQGGLIHDAILGIRDAIMIGILLTIAVLALFLRNPRAGFLAALSVPMTLVVTFLAMDLAGQTLNLMSLGGMAVAIGLVIDDAIVVVEAIVRRIEDGLPTREAIQGGLAEMTGPVIGTTITTVVVLIPLVFLSGVSGSFFRALAITLASSVLISMLFALFVLPILATRILRPRASHGRPRDRMATRYGHLLRRLIRHRWLALALAAVFVLGGLVAWRQVPSAFLPEMDEGAFVLDYFMPSGASLDETSRMALRIERILADQSAIRGWSRRTGAELGPITATETNHGDIAVLLAPRNERAEAEEVMDDVRVRIEAELPGVRIEFVQVLEDVVNDLAGNPRPIEVRVLGEDQAVLTTLAADVETRLEGTPHLVDWYRGVEADAPVLHHAIDADAAARVGLTPRDVADDIGVALHGEIVGAIPRFDRLVPVRVRFSDAARADPQAFAAMPLAAGGATVPLSHLAPATREAVPTALFRENLSQAAIATGDIEGGDLGGLARDVRARLAGLTLPPGYQLEVGGQTESQESAFRQLLIIFVLGLFAVLAVLVAQLRSLRAAVLVLAAVPPALVGALVLLAVTSVALDVSSLMGLVLLVGLVVKNGILLVQHALLELRAGAPLPVALSAGGRRRLRPILMTTACTVFGLLPLAFALGAGSELQRPLALAVIGGLVSSTVATLFVLPALAGFILPRQMQD